MTTNKPLRDFIVEKMFRWRFGFGPGAEIPTDPEVRLDAIDAATLILKELEARLPEKKPQVKGNKLPYINRPYIAGETNGYNQCLEDIKRVLKGDA